MNTTAKNVVPIHEKLMTMKLSCSFSLGTVTDKRITNEINTDNNTDALAAKKKILPGDSGKKLRELQAVLAEFYQYHIKHTTSSVNDGERLLPVLWYVDYMDMYAVYQGKVKVAFKEFHDDYPRACVAAQKKLNGAWNSTDYPTQEDLYKKLNFRAIPVPLPVASTLFNVLGECVQVDVDAYMGDVIKASVSDINKRMREALERMVRQLSDPKKKIYDTLTENLAELIGLAPALNVTDNQETNDLIADIRQRLLRVGPDELRNDPVKREDTAKAAEDILRRLT